MTGTFDMNFQVYAKGKQKLEIVENLQTAEKLNRSRRRELKFEKFSSKRRCYCGIFVVIIAGGFR